MDKLNLLVFLEFTCFSWKCDNFGLEQYFPSRKKSWKLQFFSIRNKTKEKSTPDHDHPRLSGYWEIIADNVQLISGTNKNTLVSSKNMIGIWLSYESIKELMYIIRWHTLLWPNSITFCLNSRRQIFID